MAGCCTFRAADAIRFQGDRDLAMENHERPGYFLSPQQNHLWSLQQASRGTHVAQICVQIDGPLDELKLRDAFRASVTRHEILSEGLREMVADGAYQAASAECPP